MHTLSLRRAPDGKLGVDEAIALGRKQVPYLLLALTTRGTEMFRCQVEGQSFLGSQLRRASMNAY